jgi:predicted dehydrogenase
MRRRLRIGIVGTGMVAQIMHLPYLSELDELYEVQALCDSSRTVLEHCGTRFGVDKLYTDWNQLIDEDLDAVFVLTSGSHAAPAIAAAEAGRHVFVEKPLCYSTTEGTSMLAAAERSNVVLMVGYPKRYDPAYSRAREVVQRLEDLKFVRITTLEAPYEPYVAHHRFVRGQDITAGQVEQRRASLSRLVDEAIGCAVDEARVTYEAVLIDTMVHEFNLLRGMLGEPSSVRYASLDKKAVTVVLDFNGVGCTVTWLDLPGIADYEMEACFYDPGTRVRLAFPSPYLKNAPTSLELTGGVLGGPATSTSREVVSYENSFKLELIAFHQAVTGESEAVTPGLDGLRDVALCQAVVASARSGLPQPRPTDVGVHDGGMR